MGFLDKPEDYQALGLEPPYQQVHDLSDQMISSSLNHTHKWHQIGFEIYCDAGDLRHGRLVDTNMILTGTDATGQPIFNMIDNDSLIVDDNN